MPIAISLAATGRYGSMFTSTTYTLPLYEALLLVNQFFQGFWKQAVDIAQPPLHLDEGKAFGNGIKVSPTLPSAHHSRYAESYP